MTKDWQLKYAEGMQAFRAQSVSGSNFNVVVVFAHEIDDLTAASDKGNRAAYELVGNLTHWFAMMNAAAEENAWPACASCGQITKRGEVCGWVVFVPMSPGADTGLCGSLCETCAEIGDEDEIIRRTINLLQEEFGTVEVQRLQ